MKFKTIILEEWQIDTEITPLDKRMLKVLHKQKIDHTDFDNILLFLRKILSIEDKDLLKRITLLYHNNYMEDGKYEDLTSAKISKSIYEFSDNIQALSKALDIDPNFIKQISSEEDGYLPTYTDNFSEGHNEYSVTDSRDKAMDAAYQHLEDIWEDNGASGWNQTFLQNYVEPTHWFIEEESDIRAREDEKGVTEREAREELGVIEEYDSIIWEIKNTKDEIKNNVLEMEETEFKKDEIEKEKIILQKEIESLSDYDDYDDDAVNYNEYQNDIIELQNRLNQIDGKYEEQLTKIEWLNDEYENHIESLENDKEEKNKYEGDQLLKNYVEERISYWSEEIMNDVMWYFDHYMDGSLDEALDRGEVMVDKDGLLHNSINRYGVADYLARYDGRENEIQIKDKEGNFSNTFYIYRIN
jgi:hypothetical protein